MDPLSDMSDGGEWRITMANATAIDTDDVPEAPKLTSRALIKAVNSWCSLF